MGAAAPLILTLVSTATSVAGTAISARGQSKQAKFQKKMAERNAEIAETQATDAERRGREAEANLRARVRKIRGAQTARFAAGNIALDSPLVTSAEETLFFESELDAAVIRQNAAREASAFRSQAGLDELQADLFQSAGQANVTGGVLTGAGQVADQWLQFSR